MVYVFLGKFPEKENWPEPKPKSLSGKEKAQSEAQSQLSAVECRSRFSQTLFCKLKPKEEVRKAKGKIEGQPKMRYYINQDLWSVQDQEWALEKNYRETERDLQQHTDRGGRGERGRKVFIRILIQYNETAEVNLRHSSSIWPRCYSYLHQWPLVPEYAILLHFFLALSALCMHSLM